MIALAWIIEINFHFIQGFTLETTDEVTLWKMEAVIAPVSTILLVTGIVLLVASIKFYKR